MTPDERTPRDSEADAKKPTLHFGRVLCPKCKRKGVGFADHPHAFGFKDYESASCRYCHATFKVKDQAR